MKFSFTISLKIKSKSVLMVGSGKPSWNPILHLVFFKLPKISENGKDTQEIRIPGTTIKGLIRTSATRIAQLLGMTACGEINPSKISEKHQDHKLCDVCRIFGSPGYPSKVEVSNAKMIYPTEPFLLTRISIDEKTGTKVEGALFTMEVLPPSSVFKCTIDAHNLDRREAMLLLTSIFNLKFIPFGRGSLVDVEVKFEKGKDAFMGDKELAMVVEVLENESL